MAVQRIEPAGARPLEKPRRGPQAKREEREFYLTLIPVLVMFFLSHKLFVQGVTLTGMGGR